MKTKAKTRTAPRRSSASTGSESHEWRICKPVMDALMVATLQATELARRTNYKQGTRIVDLASETMGEINTMLAFPNDQTHR